MQVQITQYAIKLYFPQTLRDYDATISLANFYSILINYSPLKNSENSQWVHNLTYVHGKFLKNKLSKHFR